MQERCTTDIDALYAGIANGESPAPEDDRLIRLIAQRAWEAASSAQVDERRTGLAVAGAIGGDRGVEVATRYLEDSDRSIRRDAYQIGVDAGDHGRPLIREAAENADEQLATDAIALLTAMKDRSATSSMRRLVKSPHAKVRAAAARLLGQIAGFAVVRELEQLKTDPDEDARRAAAEALAIILGEDGPVITPPPPPDRSAKPEAPQVAAPPPPASEWDMPQAPPPPGTPTPPGVPGGDNLSSLRKAHTSSQVKESDTAPPAPVRQLPAPRVAPPPGAEWAPDAPIPLPGTLPQEALALTRLLGQVDTPDRPAVLEALRQCGQAAVSEVLAGHRVGGDVHRARGAALAAANMGNQRWVSTLRNYLRDPDAGVRATAMLAIARLATPSVLPQMARLASDPDPIVRSATAWGLGEAGRKLGTQSMVRGYLENMQGDADATVVEAADAALSALASS